MTLEKWRIRMGWSQTHLANTLTKKLGRSISQQNIYSWETGTTPSADAATAIKKLTKGAVAWAEN